jgi:hypothetical protein
MGVVEVGLVVGMVDVDILLGLVDDGMVVGGTEVENEGDDTLLLEELDDKTGPMLEMLEILVELLENELVGLEELVEDTPQPDMETVDVTHSNSCRLPIR